jgi:hypothetical protein
VLDGCVLRMNTFKFHDTVPERVQVHHVDRSRQETEYQGVCCIEQLQVIFAGRFAAGTALRAPRPILWKLVSTGWRHSERLPAVRFPVKITSDRSMQQTPLNAITVRTARLLSDSGVIVVAVHPGLVRTGMGGPQASIERKMQLASSQAPLNSARNTAACFCKATAHPIPGESSARFTGRRARLASSR